MRGFLLICSLPALPGAGERSWVHRSFYFQFSMTLEEDLPSLILSRPSVVHYSKLQCDRTTAVYPRIKIWMSCKNDRARKTCFELWDQRSGQVSHTPSRKCIDCGRTQLSCTAPLKHTSFADEGGFTCECYRPLRS